MNKNRAITDFKRFIKWNDQEAKDRLLTSGMLIPIPKAHFQQSPGVWKECIISLDAGGFMGIYHMLRHKWRNRNK